MRMLILDFWGGGEQGGLRLVGVEEGEEEEEERRGERRL